jgi:hypothetical protein
VIKATLVALLGFQAYAVNFGVSWLPQRIILAEGYQGSQRWDWNLYTQEFYGIFGRPRREDWKMDEIFRRILQEATGGRTPVRLAVVPDLPQFNHQTLLWRARLLGLPIRPDHPQSAARGIHSFDEFDFVLMTEGDQGEPWSTRENGVLNRIILDHPERFRLVEMYPLPNGDFIRLYLCPSNGEATDAVHPA